MALPKFSCPVYMMDDLDYWKYRYQYATTSNPTAAMSPWAIICPQHPNADADVKLAIKYAADNNIGIAVRTGGHAYSGTSSTDSNNIQLDLSNAYNDWNYDEKTGLLRVGVSYSLLEFNTKLKAQSVSQLANTGLFMPTGQCYNVHVGGHVQTGGYGQLTRAFGLFSDQIVSFEIILADGTTRKVDRDSKSDLEQQDLFFAVLGGGPGNYGVMTHVTIRPRKDSDHRYSRAFKQVIPYDPKFDHNVLVQMFNLVREWENAPGDYDFSFTVASGEIDFLCNQIGIASEDDFMVRLLGGKMGSSPISFLSVYFQYSNLDNKPDTYDPSWCNKIKTILGTANQGMDWWERFKEAAEQELIDLFMTLPDDSVITPISKSVTQLWTYRGMREFNYPFLKNSQITDKIARPEDWPEWVASRIDELIRRSDEGLMVVTQCENFGGQNSAMRKNGGANKKTAYAWRDTTVGYCLDAFYNPRAENALRKLEQWQGVNIAEGIGPHGMVSIPDHRWFWASHGDLDMSKVWQFYYSSAEDYERCCKVKKLVDPNGVFTANTFVVGYTHDTARKPVALLAAPPPEQKLDDAAFTKGHAERARRRAEAKGITTVKL
jgi:FAD binding domain-containing protein